MGDVRVSQGGALVLVDYASAETRVTQGGALTLVARPADGTRVSQTGALVLADRHPCLTHEAQCWRIARVDGTVFTFTSHDMPVTFQGETYQPCDSLSASAAELTALIGQIGNAELAGIISDDAITEADLFEGLFDDARVEVWIVPWDAAGEVPWRLLVGTTGKLSQARGGYSMEVLTPGAKLQQAALVQAVTPSCRFELGDARCTVDLVPLTVTGTVTSVAALFAATAAERRVFADSSRTEVDVWFDRGLLTWTAGANAGAQAEVKDFVSATGQFTLWESMMNPILVGDTYSVRPGCDLSDGTCTAKFANLVNFGGFRDLPGIDEITKTPDAKQ